MLRCVFLVLVAAVVGYSADLDGDGLADELEQQLLEKFAPAFFVSPDDCDGSPAEFVPDSVEPKVARKDGTIYGQVFRAGEFIEIHYYHLWSKDCGRRMSHPLDAEAVTALLRADGDAWRAEYWYAAAHKNTLCDMSHGAKALDRDRGPRVWISKDKHASFFSRELCARGCGNDDCSGAEPLRVSKIVNIGEPGKLMNGALWGASAAWTLADKMRPDFVESLVARMPSGDGVELLPAREPVTGMRTTIKVAGTTYGALETANGHTQNAVATGIGTAVSSTGNALRKAVRWVRRQPLSSN